MKNVSIPNCLILVPVILCSLMIHANAEDLVFTEDEVEVIHSQEYLYFTERETANTNSNSTNAIMLRCYHHNECPAPITVGDAAKYLGYKAKPKPPQVKVAKGACEKLKKHLENNKTNVVNSARSYTGFFSSDAECNVALQAMGLSGLYKKIIK